MGRCSYSRRTRGFTLLELLMAMAIVAFLFTLVAIIANGARDRARMARTKALLKQVHLGLELYHTTWKDYPAGDPGSTEYPETWPKPYHPEGVDFDIRLLTERNTGWSGFQKEDLDKAEPYYLIDAWGQRLRYRKPSPHRILVWSYGKNKKDEIGIGMVWDAKEQTYAEEKDAKLKGGKKDRLGDDLTNQDMDY